MIAFIEGEVTSLTEHSLIIKVGGVGIRVFVPATLRVKVKPYEQLALFTSMIVREDAISLYGFQDEEERETFELLLGVNGIGPRIAVAILSALTVDAIRRAVLAEQPEIFGRVPGVGKKTGQKIILHLQGKIKGEIPVGMGSSDADGEVLEALVGLGYSIVEAQAALQSIPRDTPQDVEERLRISLRYFST
jgi:Holliday junction DNA helicase RuvA